jgi:hypothetical protein
MKRASPWFLILAGVWWMAVFASIRFPAGEEEIQLRYMARSLSMHTAIPAQYREEMPFPLPAVLLSTVPDRISMSPVLFRWPNMVVGAGVLTLIYLLTGPAVVLAATIPWLLWIAISDFPALLTLFLALAATGVATGQSRGKNPVTGGLLLLTAFSSLAGLWFGLIGGLWLAFRGKNLREKAAMAVVVLAVGGGIGGYFKNYIVKEAFTSVNGITPVAIAQEVDLRVRYEFKLNNYRDILPLPVKRLVYNKAFFAYRVLTQRLFSIFSLEKVTYPAEADATVTRSLWNSKGLPWLPFWIIVLAGGGLIYAGEATPKQKTISGLFFGWGVIALYFAGNNFLGNGVGLVIPGTILSGVAISHMGKAVKIAGGAVMAMGLLATFDYFIFHELYWRDNRPTVQSEIAEMAIRNDANVATTILGRSFLYYAWEKRMGPEELWTAVENGNNFGKIKFDHFGLKKTKPVAGTVYVGFPGEFLGDKKLDNRNDFSFKDMPGNYLLLETFRPRDTVSFGNGDEIWTVRAK